MATLYENIIALCESRGIKGGKMCADTGISKGLLTDLKMGRRTGVSAVTAQKIASYFDVSVGYLLGEEEKIKADPVGTAERHVEMITDEDLNEMFDDFKKLDAAKRQIVKDLVHSLAKA